MRQRLALAMLCACLFAWGGDNIKVGIVTCYPGADVYQLEGHTALHIKGEYQGMPIDAVVNYGLFDFNSPNFLYRFVKGETDYMCGAAPWSHFLAPYLREGRQVVEHPLLLDSLQADRLIELVNANLKPENRVYRYNYVKDNCATRPLRLIERAIGDSIILPQPTGECQDSTFRDIMRYHHRNYPWYQFGIDLALGPGIDYALTAREKAFAPTLLIDQLKGATVGGRRLVGSPTTIAPAIGEAVLGPTPWYATPTAVAWALLVVVAIVTVHDLRRRRVSRWLDTVLYTAYGVAGIVITFLVTVSTHEATTPNWLILWLNPLSLIVPLFIWLKFGKIVVMSYQIINFALILCMCVAWPFTGQSGNAAFIPLIGCDMLRSISYLIINYTDRHTPHGTVN